MSTGNIGVSDDAATPALRRRPFGRNALPVAARAVSRDRVDRGAGLRPHLLEQRRDVRLEGRLEELGGRQRIVVPLRLVERRAIESAVTDEAALLTDRTGNAAVAVIASGGWHPGVIGIVASRLKDKLKRPVIVIALEAGPDGGMIGKGSGRSVPGVDLGGAILAAKDMGLLIAGGGHAMAAGLTIDAARIDELAVFLDERLGGDVGRSSGGRSLFVDAALSPRGVCIELTEVLDSAGPYGQGWPAPRVASGPWRVAKVDIVGDNHVRAILTGGDGARIKAMAFRSGDTPLGLALASAAGRWCFVSGRVQRDDWGRTPAAELHLDDLSWVD